MAKAKGIQPHTDMKRHQSHVIDTVKGNMEGFTERQVSYAELASKAAAILAYSTEENLKYTLRQKLFKNCPLTVDDVNNAEKIFGKDVAAMKGKLTRKKPNPVRVEVVEFPPEIIAQIRDLICPWMYLMCATYPCYQALTEQSGSDRWSHWRTGPRKNYLRDLIKYCATTTALVLILER